VKILFAVAVSAMIVACTSDRIRDRPISFSEWRVNQTLEYINTRYGIKQTSLEMLPVMVVSHYTAMDTLEISYDYMNREQMEDGRSQLKKAGGANIAVHFLVGKAGDIYRLMPENHIGRHAIGLNRHSIGIENVGNDEQSLTIAQVEANDFIVRKLAQKYPLKYLIGHSEYRRFENTPLWEEKDVSYRTEKFDPGDSFMAALRTRVADLGLRDKYDRSEIPDRIDYVMRKRHEKNEFSGAVVFIDGGQVMYRQWFGKDPATNLLFTPASKFYLASAAKSLTALAIAKLEAQGKISYNQKVTKNFPSLAHLLNGVRISDLLSHTSGLEDYYKFGRPAAGFNNADALRLIATQKAPVSAPGKLFLYANSNYVLLAELISQVSGMPYADFMREQVFAPAHMSGSVFVAENPADPRLSPALDAEGKMFRYQYATLGPGGLAVTADDMANFDLALMQMRLTNVRSLSRLTKPVVLVGARQTAYAMGWYVYPERRVIYHDGNFNGYHTMNWLNLAKGQAVVLLANRHTSSIRELTWQLDRALNGLEAKNLN
jgi:CubicO group peptidase (beta-lactamase class C family)